MNLEMGSLLKDRFRLLRPLGEGGMGEVYLGEDERGGLGDSRPVAIKTLRTDAQDEVVLRRFREEAEILRRLSLSGIPTFVDAFEQDARSFLIMEYIEGHSLHELLQASPQGLPAALVTEVGAKVCDLLAHLHGHQPPLIHRDIKPANLIIRDRDEAVFLVDFGLARELTAQSGARTLVGTVDYCPLEQLQGQPEPRSDLYSLGATLFELLTGRPPKALNIPPLHSLLPDLPQELAVALDRAVRPEADERFPDAAAMAVALRAALPLLNANYVLPRPGPKPKVLPVSVDVPEPATSTPVPRRRRTLYLGVLLLTLLGALTASHYQQRVYEHEQRELLADSLPEGLPGHWQAHTLRGLFPAEGVGLWTSGNRPAGVQFVCSPPATMAGLSFRLVRLKGNPRFLAYCQPWGLLVEPQQQHYRIRLFQLNSPPSLDAPLPAIKDHIAPLLQEEFRTLRLRLSMGRSQGQLSVNRGQPLTFPVFGPWSSGALSFSLSGGPGKSRCVISEIKTW